MRSLKSDHSLKPGRFGAIERLLLRSLASGGKTAEEMLVVIYEDRGVILLSGNFYGYIKNFIKYGLVDKVKERGTSTVYRLTKEGKKVILEDAERELAAAQQIMEALRK